MINDKVLKAGFVGNPTLIIGFQDIVGAVSVGEILPKIDIFWGEKIE